MHDDDDEEETTLLRSVALQNIQTILRARQRAEQELVETKDALERLARDNERLLASERAVRMEIERVSRAKDEFLATLSHELLTPLTAVLAWTEVLNARAGADEELRRGLAVIARNTRAQAQLVEDLLDMNRIVSGKLRLNMQPVELSSIVESALESVAPSASAKSIVLRRLIDPHAGKVFGDPARLLQVVWNLLTNAIKFTGRDGTIEVVVRRVDQTTELTVRDSGVGISETFLPHIFERFRQADSSSTRKYGGLGLGLSIVKQLVELHAGSIIASSGGELQGASFTVCLPSSSTL